MNKEEIEQMFDEFIRNWRYDLSHCERDEIKKYLFETIIPEVLKSVIPKFDNLDRVWRDRSFTHQTSIIVWEQQYLEKIKQKAKQLYWIDL